MFEQAELFKSGLESKKSCMEKENYLKMLPRLSDSAFFRPFLISAHRSFSAAMQAQSETLKARRLALSPHEERPLLFEFSLYINAYAWRSASVVYPL